MRPIGIDLFAGVGGMSLGFEQAGFDVAAAVEIDPIHCAAHEFNFPQCATICRSVTEISGDEIRSRAGIGDRDVAVVFGGAPCQGFSLIGKRSLDDPRNQLVQEFLRLVAEIRPKAFVFENVPGLLAGSHRRFLDELVEQAESTGYRVTLPVQILSAQDFGVPQKRRRVFVIGVRDSVLGIPYPVPGTRRAPTVWDAISDLPDADDFAELLEGDQTRAELGPASAYSAPLRGIACDLKDFGYPRRFEERFLTASMRTLHEEKSVRRFRETEPGQTEPISRFKRLRWDGLSVTLRAGTASDRGAFTSARPIHPEHPRVITVREAARLHSYPDWFRFHATKWHGFRQIGNSVPPHLARAVGHAVRAALEEPAIRIEERIETGNPWLLTPTMSEAAEHFSVPASTIPQRTRKAG